LPSCLALTLLVPATQEVLLRGCKLKNSSFVVGVALYTGPETRIHQNASRPSLHKHGAYDEFLNVQLFALIILQVAVCVALAVASWAWREHHLGDGYFEWHAHSTGKSGNNAANGIAFGVISFLTFWCVRGWVSFQPVCSAAAVDDNNQSLPMATERYRSLGA
jgi:magnesium-transporting ATPase (P-type)